MVITSGAGQVTKVRNASTMGSQALGVDSIRRLNTQNCKLICFGFESPLGQKRRTGPLHSRLRVSPAHHVLGDHSFRFVHSVRNFSEAALSSHLEHDLPWSVACSTLLERLSCAGKWNHRG